MKAKREQLFRYYDDYFEKELFLGASQKQYFQSILGECAENEETVHVDSFGVIQENSRKAAA